MYHNRITVRNVPSRLVSRVSQVATEAIDYDGGIVPVGQIDSDKVEVVAGLESCLPALWSDPTQLNVIADSNERRVHIATVSIDGPVANLNSLRGHVPETRTLDHNSF